MVWRGELRERKVVEGRELLVQRENRERGRVWCIGIMQEKHSPESSWRKREKEFKHSQGLNKISVPKP